MTKETFNFTKEKVKPYYQKETRPYCVAITCSQALLLTLWYLATQSTFREIGHTFGLSRSGVNSVVTNIIKILNDISSTFINGQIEMKPMKMRKSSENLEISQVS